MNAAAVLAGKGGQTEERFTAVGGIYLRIGGS